MDNHYRQHMTDFLQRVIVFMDGFQLLIFDHLFQVIIEWMEEGMQDFCILFTSFWVKVFLHFLTVAEVYDEFEGSLNNELVFVHEIFLNAIDGVFLG